MHNTEEYTEIAKNLIDKHCQDIRLRNCGEFLQDVRSKIITADLKFNGRGNIYGYRKHIFLNFLRDKMRKLKRKKTCNLDESIVNNLIYNSDNFDEYLECLNSNQKEIIIMYIKHNISYEKIAKELNTTTSHVLKEYERSIEKIRNENIDY